MAAYIEQLTLEVAKPTSSSTWPRSGCFSTSSGQVVPVHPAASHPEFQERTAWSLLNALTEVLKDRQRQQPMGVAHETITLQKLLDGTYGIPVQAA